MPRPQPALWFLPLALLLGGGLAGAAPKQKPTLAVLGFEANAAAQDQRGAVEALVAGQLSDATMLQVTTLGDLPSLTGAQDCADHCLEALATTLQARYVLRGRVDRFGQGWVVSAILFDSAQQRVLTRPRAEATDEGGLPQASHQVVRQSLLALGRDATSGFTLGLKVGNNFLLGLSTFAFTSDLELGYRFEPDWTAFLQVGFTWVPRTEAIDQSFAVLPSVIGVRHLYNVARPFQPYWGLGLGLQLAVDGQFGFVRNTGPLPMVLGSAGFQYMFADRLGLGLETSTNVAQAVLGLVDQGRQGALNFDATATVGWRF
jgi:TolB-like protein